MHSLNPFLRAFFRSTFPSQCTPVGQHILLVPTTEVLLTHRDRETGSLFADLAGTEEFLGSHVLKVPPPVDNKEIGNVRENRGKAKQYTTLSGKTVVIKESFVYSNKGFKNLNQAQLISDALYYHDGLEAQQWLVYYISRPLIGTLDPVKVTVAKLPDPEATVPSTLIADGPAKDGGEASFMGSNPTKKDIHSFSDLLNNFPMIARQMQPGLERVFKEFNKDVSKPLPAIGSKSPARRSRRSSSASSRSNSNGSARERLSGRTSSFTSNGTYADDEENHMRRTLETALTAAIDLFQMVDKQQLSLLGATTELTGPAVERLIEKYITEQLHDNVLFPRLCNIHMTDEMDLQSRVRQMYYIDIAQVGIDIESGRQGKKQLIARLNRGIEEFRKLGVASGPQQMMQILLETQKIVAGTVQNVGKPPTGSEKSPAMAMNADTLVSLLLLVVIRSHVRHLEARLAYMRSFNFIDDVESGEMGYALSTFEAVLQYLSTDSGGLRIPSRRNKRLWQATKHGNILEMRSILEPDNGSISDEPDSFMSESELEAPASDQPKNNNVIHFSTAEPPDTSEERTPTFPNNANLSMQESDLSHVFPFQANGSETRLYEPPERPRSSKRVSIDVRSLSNASDYSFRSRSSTMASGTSAIEGDTSVEKICQTQDSSGNSVLMMAVDARQPESLDYLLSLEEYYPMQCVLEDRSAEDTTLLSAAIQTAHPQLIELMVNYVFSLRDTRKLKEYISEPDKMGRTVAHYIFHAPYLIPRIGALLPWRNRDKNGQTPLLALCRSYDHPHYLDMVNNALQFAVDEQPDGQILHLDNHIDIKGNTLLHVVSDPYLALRILQHCDADPNAPNEKRFTPLMVASKFGRFDLVRAMFIDNRVDVQAKEYRGMTAVELAKDDEVRNRIDDMVLVSNIPAPDGRVTAVVRSFFVEDATIRLIIKTASRSGDGMIAVTTCRRSLSDFEHLAKWLTVEHPASWIPSISNFRSPFQIPSKPSRSVLHDIQVNLDKFLKVMLTHSTFSTHELLWEFILVPELQPDMMAERSVKKSDIRQEKVKEEYTPMEDFRDVETFVSHARESIRGVNHSTKSVLRRINGIRNASTDLCVSFELTAKPMSELLFLPAPYATAFSRYAKTLVPNESDPYKTLHADFVTISSTITAILSSLARPYTLIDSIQTSQKALDRHRNSLRRSDRWPLGLLEETRKQAQLDAQDRLAKEQEQLRITGCELRYTQQIVASELAGWQDLHGKLPKSALKKLARSMVVREKDRLEGMKRALGGISTVKRPTTPKM